MQRDEPESRLPVDALSRRPGKRIFRLLVLSVSVLACTALMSQVSGIAPGHRESGAGVAANAVEARTCAQCHAEVVKSYGSNPHAQAPFTRDERGVTCADCHGPEKAHIESGGEKSKIFDPALAPSAQVDAMCLGCHQGKHATFARSPHGRSAVGCFGCHSVHSAGAPKYLLKAGETELCFQCHAGVKPQFSMPSRHNVEEGLVECSDCHDPHGTPREERQGTNARQDSLCSNCHTETAGPFVFQHAVMETEGCTACHLPHGGQYPHLLVRADVSAICQLCHLPAPDPKTGAHVAPADTHALPSQSCIDCHSDVHGSDTSIMLLKKK